ncbi:CDP-alcohol phosphatidyltransferase family protein [bacterium]|nr:CDP-alcohol phosphatidyltransferase family protein [bacterium]
MLNKSHNKIKRAVLSAFDIEDKSTRYDSVYGGETLLNRALIALSKSGISEVILAAHFGHGKRIEAGIENIRKRINLNYTILEFTKSDGFLQRLKQAVALWDEPFLMFELHSLYHASLFECIHNSNVQDSPSPVLFCHKNVSANQNGVSYEASFMEKYKVIFQSHEELTKVVIHDNRAKFANISSRKNNLSHSQNDKTYFSTDVILCRKEHIGVLPTLNSVKDIRHHFEKNNQLSIAWVENVWWLKIPKNPPKDYVKNFLWKIAFKEISGEFSKKYNSVLSKPLSFAFARLGFTPNVISIVAFLFLIGSSLLLLIDNYWTLVLSGFTWQMAAVLDRCDGEVARIRSYESTFGAQFDIITDDLGYAFQAICLTAVCFSESHHELLILIVFLLTFLWIIQAVLYEKKFMRKAGYISRQVKHKDFLSRLENDSALVRIFKNIEVFGRRDWRAVLYFILTFSGSKILIFWIFMAVGWIMGIFLYIQIGILRRPPADKQSTISYLL